MKELTLKLPYPPSANSNWRAVPGKWKVSKQGKRYRLPTQLSTASRKYHELVKKYCLIQKTIHFQGNLKVEIHAYPPQKKRGYDVDNYCKVVIDSLQHAGIYNNDYQITELIVKRFHQEDQGKVVVYIMELGGRDEK